MGALSGFGFGVAPENIKVVGNVLVETKVEVVTPVILVECEVFVPVIEVSAEVTCDP